MSDVLRLIIKLFRPLPILGGMITFALGAGIARYLGNTIDWNYYFLGQTWVILLQVSMHTLGDYFAPLADNVNPGRTPFSERSDALGPGKLPRNLALWIGIACLAVVGYLSVLLLQLVGMAPVLYLILSLIFVGALVYSVPPLRLASSGYGELLMSILIANLIPLLAYQLQADEWHRLIPMATFPLMLLHLGMMVAFEFPEYAPDTKYEKSTLLVRMGWQRGMLAHNILVLGGFVLLGIAWAYGMPLKIALPGLLVLPVGALQVWMMTRIEDGAKPNWTLFTVVAAASFGLTAYILAYSVWTR